MLAALVLAARLAGLRPGLLLSVAPAALLWPPALWSLVQLTPLWLLGLALAWHYRDRPLVAGIAVGLASLTKLFPALSLLYFVRRRQWQALLGCAAVWALALAAVLLLAPTSLAGYVAASAENTRLTAIHENGALVSHLSADLGPAGSFLALALAVSVAARTWRASGSGAWDGWVWLGVALLPVAWTYSLLPLLPGQVRALRSASLPARLAAGASLVAATLAVIPTTQPHAVLATLMLSGVASVLYRAPIAQPTSTPLLYPSP
jgi:hypothetical protein